MKTYAYGHDKETDDFFICAAVGDRVFKTLYSGIPEEDDAERLVTWLNRMEQYAVRVAV